MGVATIWKPQPKQALFQAQTAYEALYGGAAGGGKSDALLTEALRQVHIPHYRALILRKTYPQLSELIDRSRELYKAAYPKARYNISDKVWTFPSGAKIYFGSMQYVQDRINYQGKRYDYIAFDELTHFMWDEYSYMFSRNRPSGPGTIVYMRAATNPGERGHGWVKQRFITPAPPMTTMWETNEIVTPTGEKLVLKTDRIFVPSKVYDNDALLKNNPRYLASLAMLPMAEREALLNGSWDSFSGQVFMEWRNDPEHYKDRQWTHVIEPFRIPGHWRMFRGFDWGYSKPFAVGWYAVDEDARIYRIAEMYGWNGQANQGAKMEVREVGRRIREYEQEHPALKGKKIRGIADPAIFAEDGHGTGSIGDMLAREGVYFEKADHTRIPGKMQYHYRFAFDSEGYPMMYVFNTCEQFIRTIPDLVYDKTHVEDIDTTQEDHIYDECRYVLMDNPIKARKPEPKPIVYDSDPLNLHVPQKKAQIYYV